MYNEIQKTSHKNPKQLVKYPQNCRESSQLTFICLFWWAARTGQIALSGPPVSQLRIMTCFLSRCYFSLLSSLPFNPRSGAPKIQDSKLFFVCLTGLRNLCNTEL